MATPFGSSSSTSTPVATLSFMDLGDLPISCILEFVPSSLELGRLKMTCKSLRPYVKHAYRRRDNMIEKGARSRARTARKRVIRWDLARTFAIRHERLEKIHGGGCVGGWSDEDVVVPCKGCDEYTNLDLDVFDDGETEQQENYEYFVRVACLEAQEVLWEGFAPRRVTDPLFMHTSAIEEGVYGENYLLRRRLQDLHSGQLHLNLARSRLFERINFSPNPEDLDMSECGGGVSDGGENRDTNDCNKNASHKGRLGVATCRYELGTLTLTAVALEDTAEEEMKTTLLTCTSGGSHHTFTHPQNIEIARFCSKTVDSHVRSSGTFIETDIFMDRLKRQFVLSLYHMELHPDSEEEGDGNSDVSEESESYSRNLYESAAYESEDSF